MTAERKDKLYDQMIAWICEHIPDDGDLFHTLHHHFGMTKEELHDHSIESLDAFFADTGQSDDAEPENTETRTAVKSAGMELHDFISKVSDMVDGEDKTAVLNWVSFASFLNDAGGGNTTLGKELSEVYLPLCFVRNNFSDDVLQQSLDMETLGNEVIYGAMMFAAGYSHDEVRALANEGVFEDGFIPYGATEKSSLSVIGIKGRDDLLFIERYRSADSVRQMLNGAAILADVRGQKIETMLTEAARTDRDAWTITHPKLIDAVKTACAESSAIEHITLYDPENHEIVQCGTEGMTAEQSVSFFHSGSTAEPGENDVPSEKEQISSDEQDWNNPADPALSM